MSFEGHKPDKKEKKQFDDLIADIEKNFKPTQKERVEIEIGGTTALIATTEEPNIFQVSVGPRSFVVRTDRHKNVESITDLTQSTDLDTGEIEREKALDAFEKYIDKYLQ